MGAVYRSICNEADSLLLVVSKLAEKEIKLKIEIEKLMNEGFVNIAKARYIMGSTCVTKMQLPTENSNPIKPLATVCRRNINDNWSFYIERKNISKNAEKFENNTGESPECQYEGSTDSKTSLESTNGEAFKNILKTDPKSFRKYKNAFLVEDDLYQSYNDELLDEISNTDSNESLVSVTDPIRLFGILVPRALKQAQVIFNDVVDILGECATVQHELQEALRKYNHLEKVKSLIEEASKDTKIDVLTPKVYWTPSEQSTVTCYSAKLDDDEGEEDLSEGSRVSIKKSIRSVFFVDDRPQEEVSVWGSVHTVHSTDEEN